MARAPTGSEVADFKDDSRLDRMQSAAKALESVGSSFARC